MAMQGDELKALRERAKMSQAEMGEALGLTGTFIGLMERGEKPIELRTELAARFIARLHRPAPERLKLRASDIGWLPDGDRWLGQIGPFQASLTPETKGRWSISLTQRAAPHYSPPWPLWEKDLESAKAAAILNAQHGINDLEDNEAPD